MDDGTIDCLTWPGRPDNHTYNPARHWGADAASHLSTQAWQQCGRSVHLNPVLPASNFGSGFDASRLPAIAPLIQPLHPSVLS